MAGEYLWKLQNPNKSFAKAKTMAKDNFEELVTACYYGG